MTSIGEQAGDEEEHPAAKVLREHAPRMAWAEEDLDFGDGAGDVADQ